MVTNHDKILVVAIDCHTSFHKQMCAPVDLFLVHDSKDGFVYLLPNKKRHVDYFFGNTMTFIGDYLNRHGVTWNVVPWFGSVAIRLWYE